MSFVSHDLVCDNGHYTQSLYKRSEGPPACSVCGAPTRISWHSGQAPGLNSFGTVTTDGGTMTTGEFEKHRRKLEEQNPGKRVRVDAYSDQQIDQNIAERRQRTIAARKARGVDMHAVKEKRVEDLTKQKQALLRGKVDSATAAKKVSVINTKIQKTIQLHHKST